MADRHIKEWFVGCFGEAARCDEPMSRHTSLGVGGPADIFFAPETLDDLRKAIRFSSENHLPYTIVGRGTNLLVGDHGIRGLVISLERCSLGIEEEDAGLDRGTVTARAGTGLQAFCRYAIAQGFEGAEFAVGIPGSVGGGIRMNAGTDRGEISSILKSVSVLHPTGRVLEYARESLAFGYRSFSIDVKEPASEDAMPIILSGCFALKPGDPDLLRRTAADILKHRKQKQPLDIPSAGCFFKNPSSEQSAGRLIDSAGMKGTSVGGAAVSGKHANFFINTGGATCADFLELMERVQQAVKRTFGIDLYPEVTLVGS